MESLIILQRVILILKNRGSHPIFLIYLPSRFSSVSAQLYRFIGAHNSKLGLLISDSVSLSMLAKKPNVGNSTDLLSTEDFLIWPV